MQFSKRNFSKLKPSKSNPSFKPGFTPSELSFADKGNYSQTEFSLLLSAVFSAYALIFLISGMLCWVSSMLNTTKIIGYSNFLIWQSFLKGASPFYPWLFLLICIGTLVVLNYMYQFKNDALNLAASILTILLLGYSLGYWSWANLAGSFWPLVFINLAIACKCLDLLMKHLPNLLQTPTIYYYFAGGVFLLTVIFKFAFHVSILGTFLAFLVSLGIIYLFINLALKKPVLGNFTGKHLLQALAGFPFFLVKAARHGK